MTDNNQCEFNCSCHKGRLGNKAYGNHCGLCGCDAPSPNEEKKCDGECHVQSPYGFVPHAGCPLHDKMTEEERKAYSPPEQEVRGWEEEFEKLWTIGSIGVQVNFGRFTSAKQIEKEFIKHLLLADRLRLKTELEKMMRKGTEQMKCNCDGAITGRTCVAFEDGYDSALSAVLQIIE